MTTTTRQSQTVGTIGRGTALHLIDANGARCNRWGTTNGTVVAPKVVAGAEVTCKRCLALEPAPVEEPTPASREARTWDATAAETHTCAGACGQTLPAKSFPTTGTPGRRGVVCRADRDAARSAA
jgi:hypothetical protein